MSDATIVLRDAGPGDAALLATLGAALFAQTFAADNRPDDMRSYLAEAFSPERMRAELSDPDVRAWIAEPGHAAGDACGYAVLRLHAAHGAVATAGSEAAEVVRLYVDRAWQGRGLAAALMARCAETASGAGARVLWLGVWERNARAIAFYRRQGFERVAEQAFVLGTDRQNDWVMARPLGGGASSVGPGETPAAR